MTSLLALLFYFLLISCVAWASYKKQRSAEDFLMGGRSLNFYLTALSAHASDMSSWLFIGFPSAIYLGGLQQGWLAIGLLAGMYANWTWVAKPLRLATEKSKNLSLPSYLEQAFKDPTGIIRWVSALFLILFFTIYIASGLQGIGSLFQALFSLPYTTGVGGAALIVVLYTLLGGFVTVAWTDLFQALFLLAVILLTPLLALRLEDNGAVLFKGVTTSMHSSPVLVAIFLSLGWGLGYFGQPHILSKFMGIKNPEELKKSRLVGICWQFFALAGAMGVGLAGTACFPEALTNPENLFALLVQKLFSPFLGAFILCGVLAATLSTIDTMLLVLTTSMSEDFFEKYFPQHREGQKLLWAKGSLLVMGLLACSIAYYRFTSVFALVDYAWSGLGSVFGPPVLASLYLKKSSYRRALIALLGSAFLSLVWPWMQVSLSQWNLGGFFTLSDFPTLILTFLYSSIVFFFPSKKLI